MKKISTAIRGMDASKQILLDQTLNELDGTPNKAGLGANAILAVSLANARAAANAQQVPLYHYLGGTMARVLPVPMMNILNGGKHASNNIDVQEFMIVPIGAASFHEALRWGVEVYHALGSILKGRGLSTAVGDEGGFAPDLASDEEAIETILEAIQAAGYKTDDIGIALDAASSEWYADGQYTMLKKATTVEGRRADRPLKKLSDKYPILSIEDGLSDRDWEGWTEMTNKCPSSLWGTICLSPIPSGCKRN